LLVVTAFTLTGPQPNPAILGLKGAQWLTTMSICVNGIRGRLRAKEIDFTQNYLLLQFFGEK
jgi:hypothetical protein